ncbi:MAG: hypothetical protein AAF682_11265 [Planctomycetota bacterium]
MSSAFLKAALGGIVPPIAVSSLCLAPLLRRGDGTPRAAGLYGALALGLGAAAGSLFVLGGFEGVQRPVSVLQRLFWVGGIGAAAGVVEALLAKRTLLRVAARLAITGGLFYWILGFVREHQWEGNEAVMWMTGLTLATCAVWTALDAIAKRRPGPGLPLALCAAVSGTAGALAISGSGSLGQTAGALAAALGPAFVLCALRRDVTLERALAPFALLFACLLLGGHYAADLPASAALLCGASPLLAGLVLLLSGRLRPWLAVVAALIVVLAATGGAAWLGYTPTPDNPYY